MILPKTQVAVSSGVQLAGTVNSLLKENSIRRSAVMSS